MDHDHVRELLAKAGPPQQDGDMRELEFRVAELVHYENVYH